MSTKNYEKLTIEVFGQHLLESGDLDPVYIVLDKMELEQDQLFRWLLAYWCFYNCGVASYLSEKKGLGFWTAMTTAAENLVPAPGNVGRWPRGKERRHFRGVAAIKAVQQMSATFREHPEQVVGSIIQEGRSEPEDFAVVAARAQQLPLFGPWISFKVCDMLECLGIHEINFDQAAVFMFKDPVEAALRLWRLKAGLPDTAQPKDKAAAITQVVNYLQMHFKDYGAPPSFNRSVGLQEVETILCKWKSHCNGHYPLNNDLVEIREGVEPWVEFCPTAQQFLYHLPKPMEAKQEA